MAQSSINFPRVRKQRRTEKFREVEKLVELK